MKGGKRVFLFLHLHIGNKKKLNSRYIINALKLIHDMWLNDTAQCNSGYSRDHKVNMYL